jgi:hypothetical protein
MPENEPAAIDEVMRVVNERAAASVPKVVHPEVEFTSTFRDGLPWRVVVYPTPAQARAALGLPT